jgi:hypothetical protein
VVLDAFLTNDQLQHSLDFDEWLGEAWMLEKLQQKTVIIKENAIMNT